jgi:DNA-binding transcriptional MerR regulator
MRISDLSRRSAVPIATIKFYLRERLLQPGEPTGRNQAVYGEAHLRRLRLIKMFTAIGELDLTSVRRLMTAVSDDRLPLTDLFEILNQVLTAGKDTTAETGESLRRARGDADQIIESAGWEVRPDAAARAHLTLVLSAMRSLGCECEPGFFTAYQKAADGLARHEIEKLLPEQDRRAEAVARSVLLRDAFIAMQQLAREHHLTRRDGTVPAMPRDS